MVKSSTQMKNMIEDWIKIVGAKYEDSTKKVQPTHPQVEWQFLIGEALHITKTSKRNDRIDIHYALGFSKEVKEKFIKTDKNSVELSHQVNSFLLLLGLSTNWVTEANQISGLDVKTYIDEEELTRPRFYRIWDAVISASFHAGKTIMLQLNPQSLESTKMTDTSGKDMYH